MNEYYISKYILRISTCVFPSERKAEALRGVEISKEREQETVYTQGQKGVVAKERYIDVLKTECASKGCGRQIWNYS